MLLGWFICVGLVTVPMIAGGIVIIRRAEDPGTLEESDRQSAVHEAIGCEISPAVGRPGLIERVRNFELNQLNWLG